MTARWCPSGHRVVSPEDFAAWLADNGAKLVPVRHRSGPLSIVAYEDVNQRTARGEPTIVATVSSYTSSQVGKVYRLHGRAA